MCTCTVLKAGHLSAIVQVLLPGLGCLSKLGLPLLRDPIHKSLSELVYYMHTDFLIHVCTWLYALSMEVTSWSSLVHSTAFHEADDPTTGRLALPGPLPEGPVTTVEPLNSGHIGMDH